MWELADEIKFTDNNAASLVKTALVTRLTRPAGVAPRG